MIGITGRVEPALVDGPHATGVVDIEPAARGESYCLQTDVIGQRRATRREQHLVDFQLAAVAQLQGHRPVGSVQLSHRYTHAHNNTRVPKAALDELADERLQPGQQTGSTCQQGH